MKKIFCLLFIAACTDVFSQSTRIEVDLTKNIGEMKPVWSFFGYDEPNYTTMHDGQKLLTELQNLSKVPVYIRTHNLLTSKGNSDGPDLKWGYTDVYTADPEGKAIYNWIVVDSIIDSYISRGMKPLMEIGFMPKDLSSKPVPYEHTWSKGGNLWTGWTYPPSDYNTWRDLVYHWVKHSIDRYGKQEVVSWLWEVWNEPDIAYWSGTFEEYCKLYDYAADGLKKACPECTIGGPHTTSPRNEKAYDYLLKFIKHCLYGKNFATGKTGTPLQYIGFHAKGAPEYKDNRIRMNMGAQLKDIQKGFELVHSFPQLKSIPIIIGESDPEGCAACSEKRDPKYGYRNGTMYSSYTATALSCIYELMDAYQVNLKGAVNWSFEFENQDWFAGFRELATHGIDKPVLNVFRMLGQMQGMRLKVKVDGGLTIRQIIDQGIRNQNDIHTIASHEKNSAWIMISNYHDDAIPKDSSVVDLLIKNLPAHKALIEHYRVDNTFSNSYEKWKSMGSPQMIEPHQYNDLEKAGQLQLFTSPFWSNVNHSQTHIRLVLPHHAVSFLHVSW